LNDMLEHDYEPAPGLPQALPRGERVLWKGAPDARSLAQGTFHMRKLAAYFAALLLLRLGLQLRDGTSLEAALSGIAGLAILAAVALALLSVYASLVARSAMFTITDRRIVIRSGVAVPLTVNLPFSRIDAVDVRACRDGSGDIALLPERQSRVSYILLWPMVKPWRLLRVRPVLRGIPDVAGVSNLLAEALAEDARKKIADAAARSIVDSEAAPDQEIAGGDSVTGGWREWFRYPRLPLAAASSLVVISLVAVAWIRVSGTAADTFRGESGEPVVANVELFFQDRVDGSVAVIDAMDGRMIDLLEPGTNGFLRGMLRSFARARRAIDAGPEVPFSLQQTESGRLLLSDAVTGQEIDLRAFGETNAQAFGRFLYIREERADNVAAPSALPDDSADVAAVALTNQESRQ